MSKLKNKFNVIKDSVIDFADDCSKTINYNADEYAKYYGESYVKLLKEIEKQFFTQCCAEKNIIDQEEPIDKVEIEYLAKLNIANIKGKNIIFANEEFGQKEIYDLDVIKTLFNKARYNMEIDEKEMVMKVTEDKSEKLSDKFDKIYKNRDEYISKAKDVLSDCEEKARNTTKKLINNLSDWANKNL